MSGYFARLAAQVAAPTTARSPRGAVSAAPSSIEQHAEVAAPANPTVHSGDPQAIQTSQPAIEPRLTHALPVDLVRPRQTGPSGPRAEASVDSPSSLALPSPVDSGTASKDHVHAHEGLKGQVKPTILAPMTYQAEPSLSPSANRVHQDAASAPVIGFSLRESRSSPAIAQQPDPPPVPLEAPARATDQARHTFVPSEPRDRPFNIRPVEVHQAADAQRAPRSPHAPDAMPRTHISIGTITLEVRAAASAPIATPVPQAAAEPAPAPARFSLRRHHVRWS